MCDARYRMLAAAGITIFVAAQAVAYLATMAPLGDAVPPAISTTLRGGDAMPVCSWFKTTECKEAAQSDLSTCPAQTYYYQDGQSGEYVKNNGSDYCGTQREGSPETYDCTSVMVDTAGCAK